MARNIDQLDAAAALALTDKFLLAQGDTELKQEDLLALFQFLRPGMILGGKLIGANMNSTADQAITIFCPAASYSIFRVVAKNPSISLTTAQGSLYLAAGKTTIINATTGSFAAAQVNTIDTLNNAAVVAVQNNVETNNTTIYLSLTTAQGAPATADIYVYIIPFW